MTDGGVIHYAGPSPLPVKYDSKTYQYNTLVKCTHKIYQ